jgi:hypothetical protein
MSNRSFFQDQRSLVREVRDRYANIGLPGAAPVSAGIISVSGSVNNESGDTVAINGGSGISFTPGSTDTLTATAIKNAINGNSAAAKVVTATSSGTNVLIVSNVPGTVGATIGVVLAGTCTGITYNFATQGTLVGGGAGMGASLVPQSIITLTSASGTVGVTINGTSVTVTASGGDGPTAVLLQAAIAASSIASSYVTAYVGTSTLTNATVVLDINPSYTGGNIILVPSGTGVTIDRSPLSFSSSGVKTWPENKGIDPKSGNASSTSGVYQLNTAYYMVVVENEFKEVLDVSCEFLLNSATPPPAVKPWIVADQVSYASNGYILLSHMAANDTVTINGVTFTCVASGASGKQFNVGTHDSNTATNLATVINTTLGSSGFLATAIATAPSSSNGGAVFVGSTLKNCGLSASSSLRTLCFPSNGRMANGGAFILCTLANAGVVPTENSSSTDLKMHIILNNGNVANNG